MCGVGDERFTKRRENRMGGKENGRVKVDAAPWSASLSLNWCCRKKEDAGELYIEAFSSKFGIPSYFPPYGSKYMQKDNS